MSGYPTGAAFDPAAPFNLPSLDYADLRLIQNLADQYAADAFDELSTEAREWLWDERDREEVRSLLFASVSLNTKPKDEDVSQAHERAVLVLRDLFVQENRSLYEERAKQELDYED